MIQVENLTYVYPGAAVPAVSDVSFSVGEGEIFGLLGPSGAGKSTTQRVLTRRNRRFSGTARMLGTPLESWGHDFFERIGVGFELPNHYPTLTARENLEFFASLYRGPTRSPDELLELVGLGEAAGERVSAYSKGMKMRLNFVRAILHDPPLLFLDEPTAGLDPVNAATIKGLIAEERGRGKTVLLTTHNMTDVEELCDRVGFLVDGRMSVVAALPELRTRFGRRTVRVEYGGVDRTVETAEFPLDGFARDPEVLRLVDTRPIHSIHSQEANLNRVFADVTGVPLRGG